jgi:hypothetical protein
MPFYIMTKVEVERWSGKAWYPVLLSPFKTMGEATQYIKKYSWHFTDQNPYRIKEHKEKNKKQYANPFNISKWMKDDESMMAVSYKR